MFNKVEILAVNRGYSVDLDGNAISPKGRKVGTRGRQPYYYFGMRDGGKILKIYIHRLQAYQKFGNKIYNEEMEIRHLNRNSLDNSFDNIDIGSHSDNMNDVPKEVRMKAASNANKKYSDELVEAIKHDKTSGMFYKDLMAKYNISSKGTISYIINKR